MYAAPRVILAYWFDPGGQTNIKRMTIPTSSICLTPGVKQIHEVGISRTCRHNAVPTQLSQLVATVLNRRFNTLCWHSLCRQGPELIAAERRLTMWRLYWIGPRGQSNTTPPHFGPWPPNLADKPTPSFVRQVAAQFSRLGRETASAVSLPRELWPPRFGGHTAGGGPVTTLWWQAEHCHH
jgi:hypothetical protein